MCGRSSLTKTEKELEQRFGATFYSEDLERYNPLPNFNIAPTHMCPIVRADDRGHINVYRWGLIPSWAKDEKMGYRMINARIETIKDKPTYKIPFERQRCLVPLDGFYEWKREGKEKIPFRIQTSDQEVFSCAGMWDKWKSISGAIIHTFTIITTPPNEMMAEIHNRMPAILTKNEEEIWLDSSLSRDDLISVLETKYPSEQMHAYEVDPKIGSVRERGPELILPVKRPKQGSLFD